MHEYLVIPTEAVLSACKDVTECGHWTYETRRHSSFEVMSIKQFSIGGNASISMTRIHVFLISLP